MKRKLVITLKNNMIFVGFFLLLIGAFIVRKSEITIPVVSTCDTEAIFSMENILEQSWQSNVKQINQIIVPLTIDVDCEGEIELCILKQGGDLLQKSTVTALFEKGKCNDIHFSFDDLKLKPGKKYYLQLQFANYSNCGNVIIPAGLDYYGCKIDDEQQNMGVAFTIVGEKMRNISWVVFAFFPFISFSVLTMIVFKRKFEEVIGFSVLISGIILFASGLFNILEIGVKLLFLMAIAAYVISIYLFNHRQICIKEFFSPAIIIYLIFMSVILLNCNSLFLSRADEFSHWGLYVKDMFVYNSFAKHMDTVVKHVYYPPFLPVIEYWFVYINEYFSDTFLYVGYQTLVVSCLILICKVANRGVKKLVPAVAVILAIPLMFYTDIFSTLYADAVMAVMVAYILICYFSEKLDFFNALRIMAGLFALTYIKPTGVVLAGLTIFIIVGDILLEQYGNKKYAASNYLFPIICVVFICILYVAWECYLHIPEKAGGQIDNSKVESIEENVPQVKDITTASKITPKGIVDFFLLKGDDYQYDTAKKFVKRTLLGDSFKVGNISCSYFELLGVILLLAWWIGCYNKSSEYTKIPRLGMLSVVTGMLYAFFLLMTYVFSFPKNEAINLAHLERYLGSWIGGIAIAFLGIVLFALTKKGNESQILINRSIMCFVILFFLFSPTEKLVERRSDEKNMEEITDSYEKLLEISRSFADPIDTVGYICESDGGMNYLIFQNKLLPMRTEKLSIDTSDMDSLEDLLHGYEYVFWAIEDEQEREKYRELLKMQDDILNDSFYCVELDDNKVVLNYIGRVDVKGYNE